MSKEVKQFSLRKVYPRAITASALWVIIHTGYPQHAERPPRATRITGRTTGDSTFLCIVGTTDRIDHCYMPSTSAAARRPSAFVQSVFFSLACSFLSASAVRASHFPIGTMCPPAASCLSILTEHLTFFRLITHSFWNAYTYTRRDYHRATLKSS